MVRYVTVTGSFKHTAVDQSERIIPGDLWQYKQKIFKVYNPVSTMCVK